MDPRLFPDTKCGGETQVASSESATASSRIQRGINATAILQSTSTWTLNVQPPVDSLNLQKRNKNGQCRHGMRSSTWAVWADIASGRQFRQMCLFRRSIVSYNSLLNQIQFKIQFEKNWRQIWMVKWLDSAQISNLIYFFKGTQIWIVKLSDGWNLLQFGNAVKKFKWFPPRIRIERKMRGIFIQTIRAGIGQVGHRMNGTKLVLVVVHEANRARGKLFSAFNNSFVVLFRSHRRSNFCFTFVRQRSLSN